MALGHTKMIVSLEQLGRKDGESPEEVRHNTKLVKFLDRYGINYNNLGTSEIKIFDSMIRDVGADRFTKAVMKESSVVKNIDVLVELLYYLLGNHTLCKKTRVRPASAKVVASDEMKYCGKHQHTDRSSTKSL